MENIQLQPCQAHCRSGSTFRFWEVLFASQVIIMSFVVFLPKCCDTGRGGVGDGSECGVRDFMHCQPAAAENIRTLLLIYYEN
jgi:hypothetical protein